MSNWQIIKIKFKRDFAHKDENGNSEPYVLNEVMLDIVFDWFKKEIGGGK